MYAFLVDGNILGSASLDVQGVVEYGQPSTKWGTVGESVHYCILRTGVFGPGAIVTAPGAIFRVNLTVPDTDNGSVDFGVWAADYTYIKLGESYIDPGSLPYLDNDFCLVTV
jgi:hypothetical protein